VRKDPWARILSAFGEKNLLQRAVGLGAPTEGRFAYPVKKQRTKGNVETLRRSEANLDAF
jgi:hypothetical protein